MKNVYEIFDLVEKAATKDERVRVLRQHDCFPLRQILKGSFDPSVEFAVTRVPLYKPSDAPAGLGYTNLNQELKRAYIFQNEHPKLDRNLTEERREKLLIQILESLEAREATVFMNMLLKKQKVKGLNVEVVKEAFPDLF